MTYLSRLCLLATMAVLGTALIGSASSASASVLCKTTAEPCSEAYPSGTTLSGNLKSGTSFKVAGTLGLSCTSSSVEIKTTSEFGAAKLTQLTLGGCNNQCKSEARNLPYSSNVSGAGGNGTVKLQSGGSGEPSIRAENCFGFTTCTISFATATLDLEGGSPAKLIANQEPVSVSGSFCGSSGLLTATWEFTSPSSLFVAAPAAAGVCQSATGACNPYKSGTKVAASLQSGTEAIFDMALGTIKCSSSSLGGEVNASGELAKIASFSLSGCGTCPTAEAKGLPWSVATTSGGGTEAQMRILNPEIVFTGCKGFATCTLQAAEIEVDVNASDGSPALSALGKPITWSGVSCGTSGKMYAIYDVSTPTPSYFRPL